METHDPSLLLQLADVLGVLSKLLMCWPEALQEFVELDGPGVLVRDLRVLETRIPTSTQSK
jgi:hypothetical protein